VNRKPLLFSYGGGHALIIISVAQELGRRGVEYDLFGLTTAYAAFEQAGLKPMDITALLDDAIPADVASRGRALAPRPDHPHITLAQAQAYYAVGYDDLCRRFGSAEADAKVQEFGRKAFEPVSAFTRLFQRLHPSVVVTTTSPRSELAGIKAAREVGIPSLAIGDMYLVAEQEWILGDEYADHLVVMSDDVGEMLQASGHLRSQVHVLGNPAFDALASQAEDAGKRRELRKRFGVGDRKLILWPLGGAADPVVGRYLLTAEEAASALEDICRQDPTYCYIMRPHPNWPVGPMDLLHGWVDSSLTVEESILAADLICVEASTVGLQAVLTGKAVVCLRFADYVLYPDYGWATKADTVEELREIVLKNRYFAPPQSISRYVGGATQRVADLVVKLAGSPASSGDP
jgi:hypothetical protein